MNVGRASRFGALLSPCLALSMGACGSRNADPPPLAGQQPETSAHAEVHAAPGRSWRFDATAPGSLPEGFSMQAGQWSVENESDAPSGCCVLIQKAAGASSMFNLLLIEGTPLADVDLSVHLRARQGRIDQGGGVVWRARDAHNYYIARYNPLENNYRVYVVKDGQRRQLGSADVRMDTRAWHVLRVRMAADHIECFMDGRKYLDARDRTFTEPGRAGLWTKADAQTQFDDLSVDGLEASGLEGRS